MLDFGRKKKQTKVKDLLKQFFTIFLALVFFDYSEKADNIIFIIDISLNK